MAIPANLSSIRTNLSQPELKEVLAALEDGLFILVPGSLYMDKYEGGCQLDYRDVRYEVIERSEIIYSVRRIAE